MGLGRGDALEQTRRNRLESAKLESRTGPVLAEDTLKPKTSPKNSTAPKLKAS